jgi:MFS family permease
MNHRPYHALRFLDFRRLWGAQLVSLTGSQMQVVAINWHVYLLTGSPLALGLLGLVRVVPVIVFSLWGGVVADRRDRRGVLLVSQSVMTLAAIVLSGLTFFHAETTHWLYLLTAVSAAATAFDNPARNALVPRLVPREVLPGAIALNLTMFHASMIAGPGLAGLLIAAFGTAGRRGVAVIYLLNALSFLAVLVVLATMRTSGAVAEDGGRPVSVAESLREGIRFVFRTPAMVWTMTLDFFATFFSGALSLLPIFADQVLKVGPAGYGTLAAAPAAGALAGSLFTSLRPLPDRQGRILLWSVAGYGLATVVFGLSRSYPLTLLALAVVGLSDLFSTVVRVTLRQLITPDELRGRMTSVNMIFFMGGPQLGELEAGLVASLFLPVALGATVSVVSGGVLTIALAAVVAAVTPVIRDYRASTKQAPG